MKVIAEQLWFDAPHQAVVRSTELSAAPNEVLVEAHCSALSAGSELLVYRGELPSALALDSSLPALQEQEGYPVRYGYASVGTVIACGSEVDESWKGRRVFAFQPHASHYVSEPSQLIPVPDAVSNEAAVFLANMETAVNLVHDGAPLLGERVAVFGLGIVGLLTSAVLAQFPLASLQLIDPDLRRRTVAEKLGLSAVGVPSHADDGFDLMFELSGAPAALESALSVSGYCSRIVVGSWYGNKTCTLSLGGAAHRNRVSLITSQVSTIAPNLAGRWTKARRFDSAWAQLQRVQPQHWIDAQVPLADAPELYRHLHAGTDNPVQALLVY